MERYEKLVVYIISHEISLFQRFAVLYRGSTDPSRTGDINLGLRGSHHQRVQHLHEILLFRASPSDTAAPPSLAGLETLNSGLRGSHHQHIQHLHKLLLFQLFTITYSSSTLPGPDWRQSTPGS